MSHFTSNCANIQQMRLSILGGTTILSSQKNSVAASGSTVANHKSKDDKYPMKRGLAGHLGNWGGMLLTKMLIHLRAVGLENIPADKPYVIAANHETYVDGMWIASFLPRKHFRKMACIAGSDLESEHGLFGKLICRVGRAVPIDRFGNPVRGLIIAKRKVEEGNIMLVHPEGTRSPDGLLGEMKNGAAYIAMKAKVPLLPVFIDGGYEVFNRHMKLPHPFDENRKRRTVVVHFGKPLRPEDYKDTQSMSDALTAWMTEKFRNKLVPRKFSPSHT